MRSRTTRRAAPPFEVLGSGVPEELRHARMRLTLRRILTDVVGARR